MFMTLLSGNNITSTAQNKAHHWRKEVLFTIGYRMLNSVPSSEITEMTDSFCVLNSSSVNGQRKMKLQITRRTRNGWMSVWMECLRSGMTKLMKKSLWRTGERYCTLQCIRDIKEKQSSVNREDCVKSAETKSAPQL